MMPRNRIGSRIHSSSQHELCPAGPDQHMPQHQASDSKTAGQRRVITLQVTADVPKDGQSGVGAGALALLLVEWKLQQSGDDYTIPGTLSA